MITISYFAILIALTALAHILRLVFFGTEGITDADFTINDFTILGFLGEIFDFIGDVLQVIFFIQPNIPAILSVLLNLIINLPWGIYIIGIVRGGGGPQ